MIYQTIVSFWVGIYLLCTGQIGITKASEVNQIMSNLSLEYILAYFGVFSVLMGIINLAPIPALDGSLPFLWVIEKLTGGKASKLLQIIWFIGFVLLMILQVIIFYFWIF
jgi:membrane-associated protease RseP (regulator of RpoE activity)